MKGKMFLKVERVEITEGHNYAYMVPHGLAVRGMEGTGSPTNCSMNPGQAIFLDLESPTEVKPGDVYLVDLEFKKQ